MGVWLFSSQSIHFSRSITGGSKIGVIEVEGVITQSRSIIKTLHSYKNDPHIKAIVIRIDSPGGGVAPSQEIYEELIKAREQKVLDSFNGFSRSIRRLLYSLRCP